MLPSIMAWFNHWPRITVRFFFFRVCSPIQPFNLLCSLLECANNSQRQDSIKTHYWEITEYYLSQPWQEQARDSSTMLVADIPIHSWCSLRWTKFQISNGNFYFGYKRNPPSGNWYTVGIVDNDVENAFLGHWKFTAVLWNSVSLCIVYCHSHSFPFRKHSLPMATLLSIRSTSSFLWYLWRVWPVWRHSSFSHFSSTKRSLVSTHM